ncbi:PilX N-terminal domain-containing pilus assembly protein [Tolumonas lignilytica]|uniref:PilX N-terminal domain-containing pilus assembly protein n=1 Tax=Tolumonas lignilytica TaxID=1283284 RepID=UPI000467CAB4|nr:PilX N-terminal domain-containing pilus assembly protein [Tolumonas lignilytica]
MKKYSADRGMVLIVALILLLPLTLISVSVMQWAREDLKMTGAASGRSAMEQQQEGTVQNILILNSLASTIAGMQTGVSASVTTGGSTVPLTLVVDTNCKHKLRGYSTNLAESCRYVDANLSQTFDKGGMGQLQTTIGIEQRLLTTTN